MPSPPHSKESLSPHSFPSTATIDSPTIDFEHASSFLSEDGITEVPLLPISTATPHTELDQELLQVTEQPPSAVQISSQPAPTSPPQQQQQQQQQQVQQSTDSAALPNLPQPESMEIEQQQQQQQQQQVQQSTDSAALPNPPQPESMEIDQSSQYSIVDVDTPGHSQDVITSSLEENANTEGSVDAVEGDRDNSSPSQDLSQMVEDTTAKQPLAVVALLNNVPTEADAPTISPAANSDLVAILPTSTPASTSVALPTTGLSTVDNKQNNTK
jgi:hypothetical protein